MIVVDTVLEGLADAGSHPGQVEHLDLHEIMQEDHPPDPLPPHRPTADGADAGSATPGVKLSPLLLDRHAPPSPGLMRQTAKPQAG